MSYMRLAHDRATSRLLDMLAVLPHQPRVLPPHLKPPQLLAARQCRKRHHHRRSLHPHADPRVQRQSHRAALRHQRPQSTAQHGFRLRPCIHIRHPRIQARSHAAVHHRCHGTAHRLSLLAVVRDASGPRAEADALLAQAQRRDRASQGPQRAPLSSELCVCVLCVKHMTDKGAGYMSRDGIQW